jgi:hypothetical protein
VKYAGPGVVEPIAKIGLVLCCKSAHKWRCSVDNSSADGPATNQRSVTRRVGIHCCVLIETDDLWIVERIGKKCLETYRNGGVGGCLSRSVSGRLGARIFPLKKGGSARICMS